MVEAKGGKRSRSEENVENHEEEHSKSEDWMPDMSVSAKHLSTPRESEINRSLHLQLFDSDPKQVSGV